MTDLLVRGRIHRLHAAVTDWAERQRDSHREGDRPACRSCLNQNSSYKNCVSMDWAPRRHTQSTNALRLNEMQAKTKPGLAGSQLYQSGSAFQIQVSASCSSLKISTTVPAPALCFSMRASTI